MYNVDIKKAEERIGIVFDNKELLQAALTHSSYANQYKNVVYNERLEFLGDAVLQLSITQYLYNNYKSKSEGELTRYRSLIVCENSLLEISKKLKFGELIRLSKGEELTGGRERTSIQADSVEAVIAAIYLDKGIQVANEFILDRFSEIIDKALNNKIILDFKTKLQEILQKNGEVEIQYELTRFEGPPHRRKFYTNVLVDGIIKGQGEGYSKKEAEQSAAKNALIAINEYNE